MIHHYWSASLYWWSRMKRTRQKWSLGQTRRMARSHDRWRRDTWPIDRSSYWRCWYAAWVMTRSDYRAGYTYWTARGRSGARVARKTHHRAGRWWWLFWGWRWWWWRGWWAGTTAATAARWPWTNRTGTAHARSWYHGRVTHRSGTTNRTAAWTISVITGTPSNFEFI